MVLGITPNTKFVYSLRLWSIVTGAFWYIYVLKNYCLFLHSQ